MPPLPQSPVGVAVVGASAGGVEALKTFVGALPADLACPVVIVLHLASEGTSVLPQILERAGLLPVASAEHGEPLRPGRILVAPADHHVVVGRDLLELSETPRENGHRPAVDVAMRSAARSHGAGAVGIVLSGTRDDGTAGAAAIKAQGGRVLVQDPDEALYDGMPASVLSAVQVDAVLPIAGIAAWLVEAAAGRPSELEPPPPRSSDHRVSFRDDPPGDAATRFTCPDCGGVLFEEERDGVVQLRCSVGHVFSPESFSDIHGRELDRALWTAVRALEDRTVLLQRMADRALAHGQTISAEGFSRQAEEAREHRRVVRETLRRFAGGADPR